MRNGYEVQYEKDVTTGVAEQSSEKQCGNSESSENNWIQQYYGQIGIPAVAAAVRYQGDFQEHGLRSDCDPRMIVISSEAAES